MLFDHVTKKLLQKSDQFNHLKKPYEKDLHNIKRMHFNFKEAYQHKHLKTFQIMTYNKNIQQIQLLNISLLKNAYNMLQQRQVTTILENIEYLMYDHFEKDKFILKSFQEKESQKISRNKDHTQKLTNNCERCQQNIRKVNLEQLKEYLQTQYMGTLDRILLQAKMQIQEQLFTEQQDELFFKQLHKTLKKKHQNIQLNNEEIIGLINTINKDISDLDLMKKIAIQESNQFKVINNQWAKNIQKSFNQLMQISFKKKIPAFLESMLGSFQSHFRKLYNKQTSTFGSQTQDYEIASVNEFNQKLYKLKSLNFKLQNDAIWFEKQVEYHSNLIKQKQKEHKIQIEDAFKKLYDQKEVNMKLQLTINSLKKQVQFSKQQLFKKNQSLLFFKRKTSKIEKEKLQIQIQNFQNTAQKQYLNEKNLLLHHQIQSKNFIQNQQNAETKKLRIKSKKLISKIANVEKNPKKYFQTPQLLNSQAYNEKIQEDFMDEQQQKNDQAENTIFMRDQTEKSYSLKQQMKGYFEPVSMFKIENKKANKFLNKQLTPQNKFPLKFLIQQGKKQIKRVNDKIQQRIKQSRTFARIFSKKSQISINNSRNSLENSQIKYKTTKQVQPVKVSKRVHFRSQTLLNNFKPQNSHKDQSIDKHLIKDNDVEICSINAQKPNNDKKISLQIQSLLEKFQNDLIEFEKQNKNITSKLSNFSLKMMINDFLTKKQSLQRRQESLSKICLQQKKSADNNLFQKNNKTVSFFRQNDSNKKIRHVQLSEQIQGIEKTKKIDLNQKEHQSLVVSKYGQEHNKKKINKIKESQNKKYETIKRRPVFKSVINQGHQNLTSQEKKDSPGKYKYTEYIQNCGQKTVQIPKMQSRQVQKNQKSTDIFTEEDFELFINENNAYLYECNHKKSYHKNNLAKLTQCQQKSFGNLFDLIESIRLGNNSHYQQIISFIRYPYQTAKNRNFGASFVKGMKFENFLNFMQRIMFFHKNCRFSNENQICEHIIQFNRKVELFKNQVYKQSK